MVKYLLIISFNLQLVKEEFYVRLDNTNIRVTKGNISNEQLYILLHVFLDLVEVTNKRFIVFSIDKDVQSKKW